MTSPRILLADDHRLMLEGLQRLLVGYGEVVGAVEDGRAAVDAAERLHPDLILLDISMPIMNGFEAARQLRSLVPDCKIIFLTMHTDPMYATEAFHAGGAGYLLKRSAATELILAIRMVLGGKPYVSPMIVRDMLRPFINGAVKSASPIVLSAQDQDVMSMMANGRTVTEIADALEIPVEDAVTCISRIIEYVGLHSAN